MIRFRKKFKNLHFLKKESTDEARNFRSEQKKLQGIVEE